MLEIRLLGSPRAVRDGEPVPGIRGSKGWALLAYLSLSPHPVGRDRLARMLFPDAADPAASLRWNLSQLRRHLGLGLVGDPVELVVPADARIDLHVLAGGDAGEAAALPGIGEELLAGITIDDHPTFETWLAGERRHTRTMSADVLREAALLRLARGAAADAVALAEGAVRLDPLDENAAVLLVRCLREAGRSHEARTVAAEVAERLRVELGLEPASALWSAAHAPVGGAPGVSGRTTVQAQLDAGDAALAAGVVDAGIDALRQALGGARAIGDPRLQARALTALGSALVHAVRGTDQDAVALLHEAIVASEEAQLPQVAGRAERELGYVDLLRGRYARASRWFEAARVRADGDDVELSRIATFAGAARTDVADYDVAAGYLDEAVGRAERAGAGRASAMARAMRGRRHLLDGDTTAALADLDVSLRLAAGAGWRAFQPWPQTLRAEILRRRGAVGDAKEALEHALATSRQVADPCWEAMALRGLGMVAVTTGRVEEGITLLTEAPRQCQRLPDTWLWITAYGFDALADVTTGRGIADASAWTTSLEELSTAHGMRALADNAAGYRRRLA
jgi:DNA-binding SARP family transcriptional activator